MSNQFLTGLAAALAMMDVPQTASFEPVARREPKGNPPAEKKRRAKAKAARKQRLKTRAGVRK